MSNHALHKQIAELIYTLRNDLEVYVDQDCYFSTYNHDKHRIPFYLSYHASKTSAVSNVDIIVCRNNKVILACEIEESGYHPTKIFGKIFSTASAKSCRIKTNGHFNSFELDENALFLQIISDDNIPANSLKPNQGVLIENEISTRLRYFNYWIKRYRLLYGNYKSLHNGISNIIESL